MHRWLLALAIIGFPFGSLTAVEPVDYLRDIKPILRERCYACHGALKQKAKLRLDTVAFATAGGSTGPAIKPGDVAASLLLERVCDTDDRTRMPPEGKPLSAAEVALLKTGSSKAQRHRRMRSRKGTPQSIGHFNRLCVQQFQRAA
jgi:hypothetical protein